MPRGGEKFGAWWDEQAAQAAIDFFPRYLRHTEGEWAGRPFVLAPWQRDDIIRPVFGWKRSDGTRLIRLVWLEVPRKNGKTELAAGVSLLTLLGDAEPAGQVYSMAVDKDQAKIVFRKAGVMIGYADQLRRHLEVYTTSIFCPELLAAFKPLSAGPKGKHGFSPSAAIGDEVHEWDAGGAELADVVHKGTAARRQPLELYITTAGVAGEGWAWEMHELAKQLIAGDVTDPTMHAVIYAASEEQDWKSENTWRAANPNYGVSVKIDYFRTEADKAIRSPRAENNFKRFHLNLWTEQTVRWLPMGDPGWKGCTEQREDPHYWKRLPALMARRRCFGGLDLSLTKDVTSLCWAFPPDLTFKRWIFLWRFWLPADTVADEPLTRRVRYESFRDQGVLELTNGNVVDYGVVRAGINADAKAFDVQWLGADPYNASHLLMQLRDDDGLPVEFFRQGFLSMSPAAKQFERLVLGNEMEHGGNPMATWMARNAIVMRDAAGNIKPDKGKAAEKIDGIVAAVMAIGGSAGDGGRSVYEDRGVLVLG